MAEALKTLLRKLELEECQRNLGGGNGTLLLRYWLRQQPNKS